MKKQNFTINYKEIDSYLEEILLHKFEAFGNPGVYSLPKKILKEKFGDSTLEKFNEVVNRKFSTGSHDGISWEDIHYSRLDTMASIYFTTIYKHFDLDPRFFKFSYEQGFWGYKDGLNRMNMQFYLNPRTRLTLSAIGLRNSPGGPQTIDEYNKDAGNGQSYRQKNTKVILEKSIFSKKESQKSEGADLKYWQGTIRGEYYEGNLQKVDYFYYPKDDIQHNGLDRKSVGRELKGAKGKIRVNMHNSLVTLTRKFSSKKGVTFDLNVSNGIYLPDLPHGCRDITVKSSISNNLISTYERFPSKYAENYSPFLDQYSLPCRLGDLKIQREELPAKKES